MAYPNNFPTPVQQPESSILDVNNKQVYLGNQYISGPDTVSLGSSAETNLLYILNPSTSTVSLFVSDMNLNAQGASDIITYRIYNGATGVSGGTTVTPRNLRLASPNASVATMKSSPTATKGTLLQTIAIGYNAQSIVNPMFILDPGQSILITGQAASTGVAICQVIHFEK